MRVLHVVEDRIRYAHETVHAHLIARELIHHGFAEPAFAVLIDGRIKAVYLFVPESLEAQTLALRQFPYRHILCHIVT